MIKRLRARGGVARRKTLVTEIAVKDRMVSGIRTSDGAFEEAPIVV